MEKDLLENELSRKIIGFVFEIYNQLGYGLPERVYQKALEKLLNENQVKYSREKYEK